MMDDTDLVEHGLAVPKAGRVLLLACGALAHEVLALKRLNHWDHLDLHCLPAKLHNTPDAIPDAVEAAVRARRADYDDVFVLYADCGTGGLLQARCEALGVSMLEGPHCYSFFEGNQEFEARGEVTSFYLTDFLVKQFDAFVTKPLGLDRYPELRDMYFGNYTTLVYQAQVDDPALTEKARGHAADLGLDFERRFTGYGDLQVALSRL
ncbi:DUF1638 domain-containing protein [Gymnodinialimonas ceratoperidinii]|uniref:DUF1638 domain-containing protein n=1 Tax=Gymnodinialimonas ceratoperidinii TaxID=2856823 RepID=A0A8F6TVC6_9RHOB|nr:DUF1638 domain-containing protein [Gymnodinialimonas ceratoperidinii]QXT38568.1 DUF1638 domain-containing protein [Gymnodinialimonas ceratoperidinii]